MKNFFWLFENFSSQFIVLLLNLPENQENWTIYGEHELTLDELNIELAICLCNIKFQQTWIE